MPVDVTATLRKALASLQTEKAGIERQIAAIATVLGPTSGRRRGRPRTSPSARSTNGRRRRRVSAATRRALSQRMKAYWAKRREAAAKRGAKKRA